MYQIVLCNSLENKKFSKYVETQSAQSSKLYMNGYETDLVLMYNDQMHEFSQARMTLVAHLDIDITCQYQPMANVY